MPLHEHGASLFLLKTNQKSDEIDRHFSFFRVVVIINYVRSVEGKDKSCLRCNQSFVCNADDVNNCQCNSVSISTETIQFLRKTHYSDCLCINCLNHYEELLKQAKKYPLPSNSQNLIPQKHYYKENGFWVWTELYHYQKGGCCGNGCRHCAYGIDIKKE